MYFAFISRIFNIFQSFFSTLILLLSAAIWKLLPISSHILMGLLISFEILECPISKLFFLTSTTFSHIAIVLEHYAIHFEVFFKKDYTLTQVMCNHLPMYIIKGAHQGWNQSVPVRGFKTFCYGGLNICSEIRGGAKNNQCHGTVALARRAPLHIFVQIFYR